MMISSSYFPLLFLLFANNEKSGVQKIILRKERHSFVSKSSIDNSDVVVVEEVATSSRWQHRTAKRRQRTEELLHYIEDGGLPLLPLVSVAPSAKSEQSSLATIGIGMIPTLEIPHPAIIDWDTIHPDLDPMHGGKINQIADGGGKLQRNTANRMRGLRKRGQVQAFHFILSSILSAYLAKPSSAGEVRGVTIIDAGAVLGTLRLH